MSGRLIKHQKSRFDIREYKQVLRTKYKNARSSLTTTERAAMDDKIFKNVRSLPQFTQCSTVLCFVSTKQEIDTHRFINNCISKGKRVAVPYCINGTREMDFYYIDSINQLEVRTYGVLEPNAETAEKCEDFSDSICIIPGLTFDKYGYRIGYGGGYYDRFLSSKYDGLLKIGICYKVCFSGEKLIKGRYDVASDYIITESKITKRIITQKKWWK